MITWQPYKANDGTTVKDPIAASVLRGNDPNPQSGIWSLNQKSGAWQQKQQSPSPSPSPSPQPQTFTATSAVKKSGGGSLSMGSGLSIGGSSNYDKQLQGQIASMIANKPIHSNPNAQVYKPQQMSYQDALGQVGGSYQMRGEDEIKGTAQLMADLEVNPQKEALERQEQKQNLRYHNTMKQIERMYAGKDQVASQLANKMSKQQAQELAARGASMRSGLAEYHTAKINEAVAQQLAHLEINKQAAVENLMSEHNLALEQIDAALLGLEQQRGKLSAANFEKLSRLEQEMYLQQENARSQIAIHIMDQFMKGEQTKLQASLAKIEAADKKYASDIQVWLGGLDALLKASGHELSRQQMAADAMLKNKGMELDYIQTMLPYMQMTARDQALMDLDWTRTMGEVPRR